MDALDRTFDVVRLYCGFEQFKWHKIGAAAEDVYAIYNDCHC